MPQPGLPIGDAVLTLQRRIAELEREAAGLRRALEKAPVRLRQDLDDQRLAALNLAQDEMASRQRAERAEATTTFFLAAIVQSSQHAIIGKTLDGTITSWNPGAEKLYGYTAVEMEGKSIATIIPPERSTELAYYLDKLRRGERIDSSQTVRLHKDGRRIDVSLTISPIRDADGRVVGASAIARDISEQKRVEDALRQSEEFNRSLIEGSQDCIKTLDLEGHLLSMNSGGQKLLEITDLGPLLQTSWIDFWKEEDRPRVAEAIVAAATGGVGRFQAFCPSHGGQPRWWDVIVWPVYGAGRQIERLLSVSREITEQKQAAARINQLNAELEQRVQERTAALEVANVRIQRDSARIATINEALAQFIADERSQQVFETLLRNLLQLTACEYGFIDEMSQTADGQPYLTALAISNIAWDDDSRALYARYRSGELRWTNVNSLFGAIMISGKPVIANDAPNDPRRCGIPSGHPALNRFLGLPLHYGGQMVGVIGLANAPELFSDKSVAHLEPIANATASMIAALKSNRRRQRAEEELQERVTQIQAANKEMEAFSYSISHDLRAPLRAIDGFSRILMEDYAPHLPDGGQRYLRMARENTQRMGQLIDDLLAFSRLGRQPLQKKSVAPADLVRAVLADLRDQTAGRQVEFVLGELCTCQADPALLKQVFVNLLENAVKFTRGQSAARIEIGCRHGDPAGQNTYFVKDNGAGFDMQFVHKLFGVFQRLHRTEDYPGTGVGLAIVQRIIHRHGGRVWAEGAVNQGATFSFTLSQGVES